MERINLLKEEINMGIKERLETELYDELSVLEKLDIGSKEHNSGINNVTMIADRIIELKKLEADSNIKEVTQKTENELNMLKAEEEKRDRVIRNAIDVLKIGGGLGLATWAFVASMNFEKEGTLTTQGGRKVLDQLLKFVKF